MSLWFIVVIDVYECAWISVCHSIICSVSLFYLIVNLSARIKLRTVNIIGRRVYNTLRSYKPPRTGSMYRAAAATPVRIYWRISCTRKTHVESIVNTVEWKLEVEISVRVKLWVVGSKPVIRRFYWTSTATSSGSSWSTTSRGNFTSDAGRGGVVAYIQVDTWFHDAVGSGSVS